MAQSIGASSDEAEASWSRQGLEECLTEKPADWYCEGKCSVPFAEALAAPETNVPFVTHGKQFQLPMLQISSGNKRSLFLSSPLSNSLAGVQVLAHCGSHYLRQQLAGEAWTP